LGSEARIYRVSFSGELTYEINVSADKDTALWTALLEEGREFGIEPYGVEALLHLRMEKGLFTSVPIPMVRLCRTMWDLESPPPRSSDTMLASAH